MAGVVDARRQTERLSLAELARTIYFRPATLPPEFQAELMAVRHYVPRGGPFAFTTFKLVLRALQRN
jgi:carbon-monoxide dehydrogenase large subunit